MLIADSPEFCEALFVTAQRGKPYTTIATPRGPVLQLVGAKAPKPQAVLYTTARSVRCHSHRGGEQAEKEHAQDEWHPHIGGVERCAQLPSSQRVGRGPCVGKAVPTEGEGKDEAYVAFVRAEPKPSARRARGMA